MNLKQGTHVLCYATKSRSCPLSMGSGDFFLRFETAVMAKPMNDGWSLAA